jgi:hypothetical protein
MAAEAIQMGSKRTATEAELARSTNGDFGSVEESEAETSEVVGL